ncbi:MAG: histidinol dehydrogenase [Treponema sp.]|jgi:histidinol dehydrogenase|nr:histidinol dehydrogenase [Treponema sp.]
MTLITGGEFDVYWKSRAVSGNGAAGGMECDVERSVRRIIDEVRQRGDAAAREWTLRFDHTALKRFEVADDAIEAAFERLHATDTELAAALKMARDNIHRFALEQRKQFFDFECEIARGVIAGQRVIPAQKAAIYAPAGRFPLISSVLMGVVPALAAGVEEVFVASPPDGSGLPDWRILAAVRIAGDARATGIRAFAIGGAQAIAAFAFGTETIPRADVIVGPGNRYVAAAKRLLFGEAGIDFVAGPTDVLVIAGPDADPDIIAADMVAQAEHDPDARARVLAPDAGLAGRIMQAVEKRLAALTTGETASVVARTSLDGGGLIITYADEHEAARIANIIAPEHLELQCGDEANERLLPQLRNYGSLFIGEKAAEVLGDYSAGTNHTLPTYGCARFTGGLSVRHFLKTVTTLHCTEGAGYEPVVKAAETIARAEGLAGHAESAKMRLSPPPEVVF